MKRAVVALSAEHRKFLIVDQGIVPTAFNLLLNGGIAWALFRSADAVPLWGESSVAVDLLATAFLLPFLTCLIVSPLVGRRVRDGKVAPLPSDHLPVSRWFTRSAIARASLLGAVGVVCGAVPIVWALTLGSSQPFEVSSFVAFKAVWAAMLAAIITPIVGFWALASASREQ